MVLDIDEDGITPLYSAIADDKVEMDKIEKILAQPENEVYTHILDRNGVSPLLVALIKKSPFKLIHLLLKKGAWVTLNHVAKSGLTAGHVAVYNAIMDKNEEAYKNDIDILRKLDEYKMDWNAKDRDQITPAKMLRDYPQIFDDIFQTSIRVRPT